MVYGIFVREARNAAENIAIRNIGTIVSKEDATSAPKPAYEMGMDALFAKLLIISSYQVKAIISLLYYCYF